MSTCRIYARRGGRRAVVQYADERARAATLKEPVSLRTSAREPAGSVEGRGALDDRWTGDEYERLTAAFLVERKAFAELEDKVTDDGGKPVKA
ncbi:hypothetical protein ACFWD7_21375 [Streptomyces mirabilis]|uniref:hypothetical protein n=1 Tax=Streptomyces mirabilis TaxID=68239 RepID=UPI0036A5E56A